MVKLTLITLAFVASAVQCAVLKTEDSSLKRISRSPVPNGPQLHTQNWSGLARSADGQNTIFSGASAAADQGSPTAGTAFSLAASGPLAIAQDSKSSDSKAKENANTPAISARFGGDEDDQQSLIGGGKFIHGGFKESHFSYQSGGGGRFEGINGNAHKGGFSSSSSASSAQSGSLGGRNGYNIGENVHHAFGQDNSAFGSGKADRFKAQGGYQQVQPEGLGSSSSSSVQGGAFEGNNGAGIGHGYTGQNSASGEQGKYFENQDVENQQQTQGLGLANNEAQTAQNNHQSSEFDSSSYQQSSSSGNGVSGDELQSNGGNNKFGQGGFASHGKYQNSELQGSSNQQSQSGGFGTSSSSSAQSGGFGGTNNGAGLDHGYGGRYAAARGQHKHFENQGGIEQSRNPQQSQGSASTGASTGATQNGQQSSGLGSSSYQQQSSSYGKDVSGQELQSSGSQFGQRGYGSNLQTGGTSQVSGSSPAGSSGFSGFEGQSALKGALDLASQGLQASGQPGCSTCGKSSFALSNAKSHSGSAVALSING